MNYIKHFFVLTLLTCTLGLNATLEEETPILDDPNMEHIIRGIEKLLDEDNTFDSPVTKNEKIQYSHHGKKLLKQTLTYQLHNHSSMLHQSRYFWLYTQHGFILVFNPYFNPQ